MDSYLIWLGFCLFLVDWACYSSSKSKLVLTPAGLLPSFMLLRLSFIVSYLLAPLSLSPRVIGLLPIFSIFFVETDLWRANSGELLSKELILLCVSLLVYLLFFRPSVLFFISCCYFVKLLTWRRTSFIAVIFWSCCSTEFISLSTLSVRSLSTFVFIIGTISFNNF